MKEEELKKIMSKSTIETSDDFINTLMNTIEVDQKNKETSFWWSFKPILITCSILILTITFILFKFLNYSNISLSVLTKIPKTPVFVVVTLVLLFYINSIIRLNEYRGTKNRFDNKFK
ncbi:hypothetical protein IWQ47_001135 [Aquimarina sp. EL_43]|uniref:hypothetical protein n=1 Tax=Aquimarina TaxID=290174 RepID=UPI000470788C|nr:MULTISPECIES: hypothetical protein [Aquimarina]MBG6129562.1 hypothetical protein [Aquimarina sp. EL_35]MBG6150627.1 hypothetical protein [Aquimarina sp. EL_32]MBG6168065.1 hypothetical protein [Aquimarina sp. EL_43]